MRSAVEPAPAHAARPTLDLVDPAKLARLPVGAIAGAVVVDLFRATSTIQVLVEGGHEVEIVDSLREALARRALGRRCVGEWRGVTPAGFACGNSPHEVGGLPREDSPVVFLSSNGARALTQAALVTNYVLVGNLANLIALSQEIRRREGTWILVPAGCRGERRLEDDYVCARLAGAVGTAWDRSPKLAELCAALRTLHPDALRTGESARWLTEHERSGAQDLDLILGTAGESPVIPHYSGNLVRASPRPG